MVSKRNHEAKRGWGWKRGRDRLRSQDKQAEEPVVDVNAGLAKVVGMSWVGSERGHLRGVSN